MMASGAGSTGAADSQALKPHQPAAQALTKRILSHLKANGSRTVMHMDLDAFYAQVEMVRTGTPREVPLAVQQWQGLIAVSYPARDKGIKRHCTVQEALQLCPELVLVHVATYAQGDHKPAYHPDPKYATHKVSLKPYREASAKIFNIIERFIPQSQGVVERASVDEAYAELTDIVNKRIAAKFVAIMDEPNGVQRATETWDALESEEDGPQVIWGAETFVVGLGEPDPNFALGSSSPPRTGSSQPVQEATRRTRGWHDMQLNEGAALTLEIRRAIRRELGYTCSAGIASNKMLAKLVSALNKPDKQTALRQEAVLDFMRELPFTKIRNLGGKFGEQVEAEYGVTSVSDLWKYSRDQFQAKFGAQNGSWLFDAVRGINTDEVRSRTKAQTLLSAKSFRPPLNNIAEVKHWLSVFAWEIYDRITEDFEVNGRWAKTLVVSIRSPSLNNSRTCPFPPRHMCNGDVIAARALEMIKSEGETRVLPLMGCSLQAGSLFGDRGSSNIEKFFTKKVEGDGDKGGDGHVEAGALSEEETTADVGRDDGPAEPKGSIRSFFGSTIVHPPEELAIAKDTDEPAEPEIEEQPPAEPAPPLEPTFLCVKCGKWLPESSQAEHDDYHFALELSKERVVLGAGSGSGSGSGASSSSASAGNKRKQPPSGKGKGNEKKLTSFFTKQ